MNRTTMIGGVVGAMVLAAAGYGLYRFGVDRGAQRTAPTLSTSAPAAKAADRKVLYWHDPMVPAQKFDQPGKSPFMDMQLVPVYADDAADAGGVTISSRVRQNLGVRTAEVTLGNVAARVEAVGSVAFNDRDVAVVQARATGFVEKLFVRAPLDPVRKGEPLAELLIPDWVAPQEEFLATTRMQGDAAAGLRDGALQRMRIAGMDDAQIRLVTATGKAHPRQTLTAPIGGVVTELAAREGMTVAPGATLFRINGLGTVWVNAEIPEALAAQVRPNAAVQARTPALAGEVFSGRVGAILPEVNAATRTLKVRIELANPKGRLVPGMFANVSFAPTPPHEVLMVPSEAVIRTGSRTVVMVAAAAPDGGEQFQPVDIETGAEAGGMTEIRTGLQRGQKVVVSGQFLLDSEASLRATQTRMSDAPPVAPVPSQPAPGATQGATPGGKP